jgi:hypothetical protein
MFTPGPGIALLNAKLADEELAERTVQILDERYRRCVPQIRLVG